MNQVVVGLRIAKVSAFLGGCLGHKFSWDCNILYITSKCSALWGRSSRHVTVGLCMDVVEIHVGLATHLRYIRPYNRRYGQNCNKKVGGGGIRRLNIVHEQFVASFFSPPPSPAWDSGV